VAAMLTVQNIMTSGVHVLTADTTLEDAAWQLGRHGVGGAPVVDEGGRVIGVLSKTDLIDRAPGSETMRVRDAMTPLVFYVRPDDPAKRAVRLMLHEHVHRLIVVREQGKLAGIVTTMDILRAVDRGLHFEGDAIVPNELHAEPAHAVEEKED
jgi:predicted transcriptional regulator